MVSEVSAEEIDNLLEELDSLDEALRNHDEQSIRKTLNVAWLLYSGILVFFMQTGFAMLEAGAVRSKNVRNLLLKNIVDFASTTIGFFAFGYALAFGHNDEDNNEFMGTNLFFLHKFEGREKGVDKAHFFFILTFCSAAGTIMSGSMAERTKLVPYVVLSSVTACVTEALIMHWVWDPYGFLSPRNADPLFGIGVMDFAGSGVVHLTGGTAALVTAIMLGPRLDEVGVPRFSDGCRNRDFVGHSVMFSALGVLILWVGWYGFNAGSVITLSGLEDVASHIMVTTTLSAAVSMIVTFIWSISRPPFNMMLTLNGILAGLVAIAGPCALVDLWAALVIGFVAAFVNIGGSKMLVRMQIDDPLEASALHGGCGLWGALSVGLFAKEEYILQIYFPGETQTDHYGLFMGGDANLLLAMLVGALTIVAWTVGVTSIMFVLLRDGPALVGLPAWGGVRAERQAELDGLDVAYHDGFLYPQFLVPIVEALNKLWKLQSELAENSTHMGVAQSLGGHVQEPSNHSSNNPRSLHSNNNSLHPSVHSNHGSNLRAKGGDQSVSGMDPGPSIMSASHSQSLYQPSETSLHPELMYAGGSSSSNQVDDLAVLSMQPRFLLTDTNQRKPDMVREGPVRFRAKALAGRVHGSMAAQMSLQLSATGGSVESLYTVDSGS